MENRGSVMCVTMGIVLLTTLPKPEKVSADKKSEASKIKEDMTIAGSVLVGAPFLFMGAYMFYMWSTNDVVN